jgi:endonuclease YncB( thermonuclease family)
VKRRLLKEIRKILRGELRKAKRRRTGSVFVVVFLTIGVFAIDYYLQEPDAPLPDKGAQLLCEVRKISDGDTATVGCGQGKLTVRLWGIDAPETGQKPWGEESKQFLQSLLDGRRITVEIVDKDRYGRAVARLYTGNEDLGLTMVRNGQAVVYEQYNDSRAYYDAQSQAKSQSLGIWSQPGAHQNPAAWRKVNPRSS